MGAAGARQSLSALDQKRANEIRHGVYAHVFLDVKNSHKSDTLQVTTSHRFFPPILPPLSVVFHRLHFLVVCQLAVARGTASFYSSTCLCNPLRLHIFHIFFFSIFVIPFPSGVLVYFAHSLGFSYFSCSCCGAACPPAPCIRLTCRFAQLESLICDGVGIWRSGS
ncbi:hypothetical protein CSHISOI_01731 [Colletotrichum shisoi]|uniref:Uncharacterized protein n=1 Tax=Colletotrichum shisoi TaxID=2078593 RepID=A0A5Q4C403_9PEZI|nr:hypothetical protein CSHISOI_01731 [Colletotrichum shisoi]